jgi:hypothetical protein
MSGVPDGLIETWRRVAFNVRGGPLTYRKFVSESRNHKTGSITPTFTNSLIALTLCSVTGSAESATITVRVPYSSLPEYPPSKQSRLVYRGIDWLIQRYTADQSLSVVDLECVRP